MEILAMGIRSGQRVPGKNIKNIEGKPLFKWGIDAARKASMLQG